MIREWLTKTSTPVRIALGVVLLGGMLSLLLIFFAVTRPDPYPLASGDSVTTWSFKGALADGGKGETATKEEILKLKGLLGKSTNDYEVLVGIASQFVLLGDGKSAYLYLSKAVESNPQKGLAYFNMGHLMEQLGAVETARSAYTQAVEAEPASTVYRSYLVVFTSSYPKRKS